MTFCSLSSHRRKERRKVRVDARMYAYAHERGRAEWGVIGEGLTEETGTGSGRERETLEESESEGWGGPIT